MTGTRLLIISGKGGVGKTTISAATAVGAAQRGYRTLVVSLDRAHSLGDVLDVKLASSPVSVPLNAHEKLSSPTGLSDTPSNLDAMEVDPQVELKRNWGTLQQYLERFLRYLGVDGVAADELAVFPGLEELLVLTRLSDLAETGDYDLIVADMAPTASSLRYLSFPDMMDGMLGTLVKWDQRFATVLRPLQGKLLQMPVPETEVYESLKDVTERLRRLRTLLSDASRTVVRLVMTPESIVLEETRRALTYINLFGLAVDSIVVNRVLPETALTGYFRGWGQVQKRILASVRESFADFPVFSLPFQATEVLGIEQLQTTFTSLYGNADPTDFTRAKRPFEYRQDGDTTLLLVHLQNASSEDLDLKRRDGNLILTVAGWRRIIALPDSLLEAPVAKARLAGGTLTIQFENQRR